MIKNNLYTVQDGKTHIVGEFITEKKYGIKKITTTPNKPVKFTHHVFPWLRRRLVGMGYDPEIDQKGNVYVTIPNCDNVGHVLSKIAWAYFCSQEAS